MNWVIIYALVSVYRTLLNFILGTARVISKQRNVQTKRLPFTEFVYMKKTNQFENRKKMRRIWNGGI